MSEPTKTPTPKPRKPRAPRKPKPSAQAPAAPASTVEPDAPAKVPATESAGRFGEVPAALVLDARNRLCATAPNFTPQILAWDAETALVCLGVCAAAYELATKDS